MRGEICDALDQKFGGEGDIVLPDMKKLFPLENNAVKEEAQDI